MDDSQEAERALTAKALAPPGTVSAALLGRVGSHTSYDCSLRESQDRGPNFSGDDPLMSKRRNGPSREAQRFAWLVQQLEAAGMSQSELSRRTGIETSYINKLRNLESTGKTAIGADIVRKVRDGLKVSPDYFFDDYEGPRDHRLYLLSAKRDEKRVSAIEEHAAKLESQVASQDIQLASMRAELVAIRHAVDGHPAKKRRAQ